MKLSRAVSEAEYRPITRTQTLETIAGYLEGKWFAERFNDARAWGASFTGTTGVPRDRIITVTIDDPSAVALFRMELLDNIGPARFATVQELHQFTINTETT